MLEVVAEHVLRQLGRCCVTHDPDVDLVSQQRLRQARAQAKSEHATREPGTAGAQGVVRGQRRRSAASGAER